MTNSNNYRGVALSSMFDKPPLYISETNGARKLKLGVLVGL